MEKAGELTDKESQKKILEALLKRINAVSEHLQAKILLKKEQMIKVKEQKKEERED